jgi:hypothetical protein
MEQWWATSLVMECKLAGVPVFVKQLGGHPDKRDEVEKWAEELRVREFPREEEDLTTKNTKFTKKEG